MPPAALGVAIALLLALPTSRAEPPPRFHASPAKPVAAELEKQLGPLRFKGAVAIARPDAKFFGWSGFWVSPDGSRFAAVEGGEWAQGALFYDHDGNLASLTVQAAGRLLDEKGQPFSHPDDQDAEALDFDGSRFLVGFETRDRVLAGWLFTSNGARPVWLRKGRGLPVSLSAFANGDLLLLEVMPDRVKITQTRVSRIPARDVASGGTMRPRRIATLGPPLAHGRFEGSGVRQGERGETLLYLMMNDSPAALYLFKLHQ